jgi:transcriptional regulator with XRE-family HTH domain
MCLYSEIKKLRELRGYSQDYLAEKLQISQTAYSRMESGKTKVDVKRLEMISYILDVDIQVFLNSPERSNKMSNNVNGKDFSDSLRNKIKNLEIEIKFLRAFVISHFPTYNLDI